MAMFIEALSSLKTCDVCIWHGFGHGGVRWFWAWRCAVVLGMEMVMGMKIGGGDGCEDGDGHGCVDFRWQAT